MAIVIRKVRLVRLLIILGIALQVTLLLLQNYAAKSDIKNSENVVTLPSASISSSSSSSSSSSLSLPTPMTMTMSNAKKGKKKNKNGNNGGLQATTSRRIHKNNDYADNNHTIAYAISVTDCPVNHTHTVLDGAAVLGHSIYLHSLRNNEDSSSSSSSIYDYALFAFVHQDATACADPLTRLGYTVRVLQDSLPPETTSTLSQDILEAMERRGCCGIKEFLKLHVYTLTDYPLAIHLDTDALIVRPMDPLYDAILFRSSSSRRINNINKERGAERVVKEENDDRHDKTSKTTSTATASLSRQLVAPNQPHWIDPRQQQQQHEEEIVDFSRFDFFFTRDYHQQSQFSKNPKHYGVQGGFLMVRPNLTMYNELTGTTILKKGILFSEHQGWNHLGYGGYWGASQIQGYLSFVYGEYYPHRALELNRCHINAMINDDPMEEIKPKQEKRREEFRRRKNQQVSNNRNNNHNDNTTSTTTTTTASTCRTRTPTCQDCRIANWTDVYSVHLTTCRKPWECPFLRPPQPELCQTAHHAWYKTRRSLELSWGQEPPGKQNGWQTERTLAYCVKHPTKRRVYRPIELPTTTTPASAIITSSSSLSAYSKTQE